MGMPIASAVVWLSPSPPGERVAIGRVWASPSSTTRLVSAPARLTVMRSPSGPTTVAVCSNSGAACLTAGDSMSIEFGMTKIGPPGGPGTAPCTP